ncbi:MAG: efflux RND transporter periplasmic adaptor subunit [Betaproteobacteria bacterium]
MVSDNPLRLAVLPWASAASGLVVLMLAAMPQPGAAQARPVPVPVPVPVVAVGGAGAAAGFEFEGTLEPQQQSVIAAQVSGVLRQLAVKAGDRVKAGQLLARVDERELAAGLAAGDAGVAQTQAALAQARQNAQRTRELRAQGFVSVAALDTAQAQLDAAEAALAAAQAGRQQAAVARGFTSITAPFDGVVRATHAEAGELAAPGRPLLTLYAPQRLRASVMLPLSRAEAARAAREVQVLLPDGRALVPQRRTELPAADATSQTVEWRLDLAATADALPPGLPVRVRFAGEPAAAAPAPLSVPAAAVLRRGELTAVYAAAEGRFVLKAVRTGTPVGGQVPVLAGLKAGERVAADAVKAGLAGAVPAPAAAN